ncbi:hypothetical protein DPMN_142239 [Dreissena polymorpha]|uniref:Uncharacterized protein n=1 Tax=Dreissena polymorpha TaxID=45954 RepID=A0A9D4JIG6_DREPO|nr:hypothetical protein DPMN_142239 [Dreissena polymorpha]
MEQKWQKIKVAVTSIYQEVLSSKSYTHKRCISTETLKQVVKDEISVNNSKT